MSTPRSQAATTVAYSPKLLVNCFAASGCSGHRAKSNVDYYGIGRPHSQATPIVANYQELNHCMYHIAFVMTNLVLWMEHLD